METALSNQSEWVAGTMVTTSQHQLPSEYPPAYIHGGCPKCVLAEKYTSSYMQSNGEELLMNLTETKDDAETVVTLDEQIFKQCPKLRDIVMDMLASMISQWNE